MSTRQRLRGRAAARRILRLDVRRSRLPLAALLVASTALALACSEAETRNGTAPEVSRSYRAPKPNVPLERRVAFEDAAAGQIVYVPVYSHIFHHGGRPYLLEATLSVRNTDRDRGVTINAVDYYDSDGRRVRRLLEAPLALGPLATAEFLIESQDTEGGSGANFLVEWVADRPISIPMIECLMVGRSGTHGLSFARSGRAIAEKP